jgi:hypothetical protein
MFVVNVTDSQGHVSGKAFCLRASAVIFARKVISDGAERARIYDLPGVENARIAIASAQGPGATLIGETSQRQVLGWSG